MRWLAWLAMGVVAMVLAGCGPEETAILGCNDPAFGGVEEDCGVWVSASLGSDQNPGTRAAPLASLTAAVQKARDAQKDVYACGELWTDPLVLPSNVSLYGGFDCANDWKYGGQLHRARVETAPGQIPLKTAGDYGLMDVFDFAFIAADAVDPGGSSIAAIVAKYDSVVFRRCTLVAGRGADGLDGELLEEPAAPGAPGSPGADACTTPDGPGGPAVETACAPAETSQGGKGGSGGPLTAADGDPGLPPPPGDKDPTNPADGDPGKGQTAADPCTPGEPGADGANGPHAAKIPPSPEDDGFVSIDGFRGVDGGDGQPGSPAQGGGGGGASRGSAAVCGAATGGGAGGGSGGAGGCGGKAGKGGQAGGSSITVLNLSGSADVDYQQCELWVSEAGDGGDGSPGQPGGAGGLAGSGGIGQDTVQAACQGGKGGTGGRGGAGGGGGGGHSLHIGFRTSYAQGEWPGTTFQGEVDPGRGGSGGDPLAPEGLYGRGAAIAPVSIWGFQQ